MKGKVYLVGAGPGNAGLCTVRGKEVLAQADVVIYDALVNPSILDWTSSKCVRIYAGKRSKGGRTEQGSINRLMAKYAKMGKKVVRLKGGDPFLFGRGGEEAEFLAERKIPFEIVPGVSSITAVPAYAGIPVTDRRYNSMLTVVTGHSGKDPFESSCVDWDKIAPRGTLVILMGVENLMQIVNDLLKKGWSPSTPIAVISSGTLSNQRTAAGTLATIKMILKKMKPSIASPAVIVIGNVVRLRQKLNWFKP